MTVRRRLLAAFGVVTLLLVLPAAFAVVRLTDLQNLAVEERGHHASASLAMGRFEAALTRYDLYLRAFVATPGAGPREEVRRSIETLAREVDVLEQASYGDAAAEMSPMVTALRVSTRQIDELVDAGRIGDATIAFGRIQPLIARAGARVALAARSVDRRAEADFQRAHEISSAARTGTIAALLIAVFVAGGVVVWVTGVLTSPLRRLMRATARVREGSFEAPADLPYRRRDEIGELSRSFRGMTQRLAELDRMKAEFVAVASHELKTPINVIQGYTNLIEEELYGNITDHQREILRGIVEQTRSMAHLVSRLMDISRLEAGTYRLELDEVSVRDLLTGVVRAQELVARRNGLQLELLIEDSAPDTLEIDVDIVRDEVLGNLVSNAIKFAPRATTVEISAWGEGDRAVFEVADEGPGVPPEHRLHIFEKYYQVERSRAVGSGLGLAIAREMVEAHGGSIELVEGGRTGAVFRVALPVRTEEDDAPGTADASPAAVGRGDGGERAASGTGGEHGAQEADDDERARLLADASPDRDG